jgi:flagellar biosynthesis/type III secretory pathway chaperone
MGFGGSKGIEGISKDKRHLVIAADYLDQERENKPRFISLNRYKESLKAIGRKAVVTWE